MEEVEVWDKAWTRRWSSAGSKHPDNLKSGPIYPRSSSKVRIMSTVGQRPAQAHDSALASAADRMLNSEIYVAEAGLCKPLCAASGCKKVDYVA